MKIKLKEFLLGKPEPRTRSEVLAWKNANPTNKQDYLKSLSPAQYLRLCIESDIMRTFYEYQKKKTFLDRLKDDYKTAFNPRTFYCFPTGEIDINKLVKKVDKVLLSLRITPEIEKKLTKIEAMIILGHFHEIWIREEKKQSDT